MRLTLGGYGGPVLPLVLSLPDGVPFAKAQYINKGYTNYEIICIGASGGFGGGVLPKDPPGSENDARRPFGGSPGGGGIHRVRGFLADLENSEAVVVGQAGEDAPDIPFEPFDLPNQGGPGGYSMFGDSRCVAGGGSGGGGAFPYGFDSFWRGGTGGNGGMGGVTDPGTGADGGVSGFVGVGKTNGINGVWVPSIGRGSGGGGGAGGCAVWDDEEEGFYPEDLGTNGGIGAYHATDLPYLCPGQPVQMAEVGEEGNFYRGGVGGGAKATPLNSLLTAFGSRLPGAQPGGVVLIRLTKV